MRHYIKLRNVHALILGYGGRKCLHIAYKIRYKNNGDNDTDITNGNEYRNKATNKKNTQRKRERGEQPTNENIKWKCTRGYAVFIYIRVYIFNMLALSGWNTIHLSRYHITHYFSNIHIRRAVEMDAKFNITKRTCISLVTAILTQFNRPVFFFFWNGIDRQKQNPLMVFFGAENKSQKFFNALNIRFNNSVIKDVEEINSNEIKRSQTLTLPNDITSRR